MGIFNRMENFLLYRDIFAPFSFTGTMWPVLIVVFFFSVVLHEVAHGYAAYISGDSTAKTMGRITLNPIPHIDIFGTFIVPFLLFKFAGVIIGWAKPVPINPYNFRKLVHGILNTISPQDKIEREAKKPPPGGTATRPSWDLPPAFRDRKKEQ